MKFNERELAAWAATFIPDKEGLLEKRGAGISHGYRTRWFRLKGNLLFYFKVDESGDWQNTGDPLGVIVLERVSVDRLHNDTKPYSFVLNFEGDDSRAYFLTAYSESEMVGWMKAIQMASYEGLKGMLYMLQNRLTSLTGEDPLKDKHVSFIGPQVSQHKITQQVFDAKRSLYIRSSNTVRAKKLSNLIVSPEKSNPQYELSISCTSLPLDKQGMPPSTVIRVRSYKNQGDRHALATIGHTEIVQSSVAPNFTHLILLETGSLCLPTSCLKFEVFSVNDSQVTPSLEKSYKITLPRNSSSPVVSLILVGSKAPD